MTQEEKIKDLEERIAIMQATDSELCATLAHWKKVAAGLKGYNKQLTEEVKKWKAYGKEADEMNEERIAKIEEKEKVIEGLNAQVFDLSEKIKNSFDSIRKKNDEIIALKNEVFELKTPWWKKLF